MYTVDVERARALLDRVRAADGRAPDGPPDADAYEVHARTDASGELIALAWRATSDDAAELYVDPTHRGRGIGRELAEVLLDRDFGSDAEDLPHVADLPAPEAPRPGIWAHGTLPAARHLAASLGLTAERELLQLRAPLARFRSAIEPSLFAQDVTQQIDDAPPPGVVIRTFTPGADDAEFLRVNAAAFAWHPEQGRLSQADLDAEKTEPWFDADGFFLAVEADDPERVLGFHWTKVHPAQPPAEPESLGEIYVLGVDPASPVRHLGGPLTAAGLRHLAARGLGTALLYVEADNERAIKLYRRYGFTDHAVDTVFG